MFIYSGVNYMHRFIVYLDWYSCDYPNFQGIPRFRKHRMADHHI